MDLIVEDRNVQVGFLLFRDQGISRLYRLESFISLVKFGSRTGWKACASDANCINLDASSQPTASSALMKLGTHLVTDLLYLFTILTAFMNQNPSLKANRPLGSQEISAFYGNQKFVPTFQRAHPLSLS